MGPTNFLRSLAPEANEPGESGATPKTKPEAVNAATAQETIQGADPKPTAAAAATPPPAGAK